MKKVRWNKKRQKDLLKVLEGYTVKEIAMYIGVSTNAIYKQLGSRNIRLRVNPLDKVKSEIRSLVDTMSDKELSSHFHTEVNKIRWFLSSRNIKRVDRYRHTTKEIKYKIDSETGCWVCTSHHRVGPSSNYQYPVITRNGRKEFMSRYMLRKKLGKEIREGYYACHHCDNPACINPDHIYEGSHRDNTRDMVKRNRQAKGTDVSTAKLNDDQVGEIKSLVAGANTSKMRELGNIYGVSYRTIRDIRDIVSWKHI